MTCTTCGATNETTASACVVCGAALGTAELPTPEPATVGGDGPPPPPAPQPAAPRQAGVGSDSRGWAVAAHLSGLGVGLLSAAILSFLGPLVIWLIRKDEDVYVDHHAKEALNFHLTVLLAMVVGAVLAIPAVIIGVLTLGIGLILMAGIIIAAIVLWFVLPILATVKASNGEGYRYPFTIRFVS